jgi:hypothetical protein
MSSTSVVIAIGPATSTPDVFNFGGGRCQKYRQHPQWARHRGLQLRWWPLPDLPPAPPADVFNFGGGRCQKYRRHLPVSHRRRFLVLMVGAPGPPVPAPPGGPGFWPHLRVRSLF